MSAIVTLMDPKNSEQMTPTPPRNASKDGWKSIASTVAILIIAPLLAIFLTFFVFQSYEVYGASMENNLYTGDRLIVQKLSRNWAKIRGEQYVPQRFEIVIFDKPRFLSTDEDVKHLIKRVIGLPGDRVVVADGIVTVYNTENPDGIAIDEGQAYAENIPPSTPGNVDITVASDEIFVIGDNRVNSQDSRSFGAIKVDSVTGVALFRFIPLSNASSL